MPDLPRLPITLDFEQGVQLSNIKKLYWSTLKQKRKLTVSEWADKYRYLSAEASAEPGRWRTDRVPYMRGVMDAICDTTHEIVVFMASSQVSKTEGSGLNWIGQTMHEDPCPMLVVVPNLEDARFFSKTRLSTMIRDTPCLRPLVKESGRGKKVALGDSNETLSKSFPGGHVTMVGSNSPSGLASRPIRKVYFDELDRCEPAAGTEGDQVQLVLRRMATFWNRKLVLTSTPGVKGISRIEKWYLESDQRKFFMPCPECSHYQVLEFENMAWDEDDAGGYRFDTAHFICQGCHCRIEEHYKHWMLSQGEWRATNPAGSNIAGFWIWAAYSPWQTWEEIARGYVTAKRQGVEEHKAYVNTVLGRTWEERGQRVNWQLLADRADPVPQWVVPAPVLFLTAGIDVQLDRMELSVWGWGPDEESWLVGHDAILGDPDVDETWTALDQYLYANWRQPAHNCRMSLTAACIDTGFKTQAVYRNVRKKQGSALFAVKGSSNMEAPRISTPRYQDVTIGGAVIKDGLALRILGTNILKQTLYSRFMLPLSQDAILTPRAVHFPEGMPTEYYKQLTAEQLVTIVKAGKSRNEWRKNYRNEALDCAVYAYAAALIAGIEHLDWRALRVPDQQAGKPSYDYHSGDGQRNQGMVPQLHSQVGGRRVRRSRL